MRVPWWAIGLVAGIALLSLAATALSHGSVSTFAALVGALSTLAAFVAAVMAARYAKSAFDLETTRDNRFQESQRRAQASLIAAWPDQALKGSDHGPMFGPVQVASVALRNASQLPVTQVQIQVRVGFNGFGLTVIDVLPPMESPHQVILDGWEVAAIQASEEELHAVRGVALWFRDAAGVKWFRDQDGVLTEGHPPARQPYQNFGSKPATIKDPGEEDDVQGESGQ